LGNWGKFRYLQVG